VATSGAESAKRKRRNTALPGLKTPSKIIKQTAGIAGSSTAHKTIKNLHSHSLRPGSYNDSKELNSMPSFLTEKQNRKLVHVAGHLSQEETELNSGVNFKPSDTSNAASGSLLANGGTSGTMTSNE